MFIDKLQHEIDDACSRSKTRTKRHGTAPMALLQIAEPGMSTEPHQHRLAVGIDLGTTNSLVATVRNGIAEVPARRTGDAPAALGGALPPTADRRRASRR
jgi:hypothetical protein